MAIIKTSVQRMFNLFGFKLVNIRKEEKLKLDIDLYKRIYSEDSIKNKKFYNIGAGTFRHPYWTNIDYESDWYSGAQRKSHFINFDLFSLDKLPIPDDSAEIVYSSHTVEHINDEAAQNIFNEANRILKKGGTFRFSTPNVDLEYKAYSNGDRDYFYWIDAYSVRKNYERIKLKMPMKESSVQQVFLFHFASSLSELVNDESLETVSDEEIDEIFSKLDYEEALNYFTSRCPLTVQMKYPGFHMNWWNEKKAFRMLREAGFDEIYRSGFGQSFCPVLRNTLLFDNTHPKVSLYIEATKT
ncbi:MAG: methyltransferase domain-containing protein [Candidatus Odinarchaeota archaeon]